MNSNTRAGTVLLSLLALVAGIMATVPHAPSVQAAPTGNVIVDPTFASGQAYGGSAWALHEQADGQTLVAGWFATTSSEGHFGLLRLRADGTPDPAFDASLRFDDAVQTIITQPDGKIVVGGYFSAVNGTPRGRIARLNGDGTLDATFNPGSGFALGGGEAVVRSMVTVGGQLIVGGAFDSFNRTAQEGLVRLQPSGALDTGYRPQLAGGPVPPHVNSMALQPDGRLLVGGSFTSLNGAMRINLGRLNADGSTDTGFTTGWGFNDVVNTVAVDGRGLVTVGGAFTAFNLNPAGLIVRLFANGYRDQGFLVAFAKGGGRGQVTSLVTNRFGVGAAVGDFTECFGAPSGDFNWDLTWGASGGVASFTGNGAGTQEWCDHSAYSGIGLTPPTVAGRTFLPMAVGHEYTMTIAGDIGSPGGIARYSVMRPDYHFGADGFAPFPVVSNGFDGPVTTIARQPDGKIIVGGSFTHYNGKPCTGLARLNADGTLDPGFDASAVITGPVSTLSIEPGGTILVAGDLPPAGGYEQQGVVRLLANGTLAPGFTVTPLTSSGSLDVQSLVVQPDGKVLLAGRFGWAGGLSIPDGRLGRLNADGTRDPEFPDVLFGPFDPHASTRVTDVALQQDGSVVVVGRFQTAAGQPANGIARLTPTGQFDPRFMAGTGFGGGPVTSRELLPQPDGPLIVVGDFTTYNGIGRNGVVRLSADGVLDATFNPGTGFRGAEYSPPPLVYPAPVSTGALQTDGKVVVGGSFTSFNGVPRNGLARLNSNGTLDTGFDPGGGARGTIASIVVQPDGAVLLGGDFFGFNSAEPPPVNITRVSPPPMTPPDAPSIVVAVPGPGQVQIGFTPPANDGGSPVTNYEYSLDGGGWWPRTPASVTSPLIIDGLTDGHSYQVRLRAVNVIGPGSASTPTTVVVGAPPATVFVPIDPARTTDSRVSSGGAGPLAVGEMRTVSVAHALIGGATVVPPGALAVAYNLTVPTPAGAGHLRVMPANAPMLTTASAINFRPGESIANAATVKLGADRSITLFNGASAPVDAIIDVVGYFVPPGAGPGAGKFTPVTPVRVYDAAADPVGALPGGAQRLVSTAATQDGAAPVVPVGASAVAYNITVVDPAGAGHLRVQPGDRPGLTATSIINWSMPGERIANGAVVGVDAERRLRVHNGSGLPVRFLVDVVGYYSTVGQDFYPVEPVRVTESRPLFGGVGPIAPVPAGVRPVSVATSHAGGVLVVPAGASAVAFNATVVATGSVGHLRVYPTDQPLPGASVLNWPGAGYTRANAGVVGISPDRQVTLYNGAGTPSNVLIDINGYYR